MTKLRQSASARRGMMNWLIKTMLAALLLPTIALADEWKDESSKGWKGWSGETPGWARLLGWALSAPASSRCLAGTSASVLLPAASDRIPVRPAPLRLVEGRLERLEQGASGARQGVAQARGGGVQRVAQTLLERLNPPCAAALRLDSMGTDVLVRAAAGRNSPRSVKRIGSFESCRHLRGCAHVS